MLHLSRPTCGILETGCMAVYNMMMNIFKCLFYAAQGYSVQYLFEGFMLPKRSVSRYQSMKCNKWLAGSVWIVTEMMADLLFSRVNRKPQFTIMDIVQSGRFKIGKTLLCSIVLYLFCLCWYQGKWLLKLFLVILFFWMASPVSGHMISRLEAMTDEHLGEIQIIDGMDRENEKAQNEAAEGDGKG